MNDIETLCPRCGAAFACGVHRPAAAPCACASVSLPPARRNALRQAGHAGCLCLACLTAVAGGADPQPRDEPARSAG